MEFPDEVELHPNVLARERLHRYRGLKSFRTSNWEITEDVPYQPDNWNALTRVKNYKHTKLKAHREALEGGVAPGSRVKVYLRSLPIDAVKDFNHSQGQEVKGLFSLLRHEPLFSEGGATKNNVHKFERFLQLTRSSVATFIGEIVLANVPALWWRENAQGITPIAPLCSADYVLILISTHRFSGLGGIGFILIYRS